MCCDSAQSDKGIIAALCSSRFVRSPLYHKPRMIRARGVQPRWICNDLTHQAVGAGNNCQRRYAPALQHSLDKVARLHQVELVHVEKVA